MIRVLLLLVALGSVSTATAAAIYKWTDKQGHVHYSDQPAPGATPIDTRSLSTYTPPPLPAATSGPSNVNGKAAASVYAQFAIVAPSDDATIRDNTGTVAVRLNINPPLRPGDAVALEVDGQRQAQTFAGSSMSLQGVDRGQHTLQALIVDSGGATVATSATVTFFLQRYSQLFGPPAQGKPHPSGPVRQAPRAPLAPRAPHAP